MKGNLHGQGTYVGEHISQPNGVDDASAIEIPEGKNSYEGNWEHGMKHGYGVFVWSDGSKYEGYFKDDQFHGEGEYTRSDGKHYKGTNSFKTL